MFVLFRDEVFKNCGTGFKGNHLHSEKIESNFRDYFTILPPEIKLLITACERVC